MVANPPFSNKNWTSGVNIEEDPFDRFAYGVPPSKNGDYAFLLHILKSMKSTAKAAVILPHGVLFRGNAEEDIRTKLIKQGYIKGIIGLPANLFYGTGIPACIIVLDKNDAHVRKGVFMLDASKGFIKDGNKNRLRSQDIHKIVDVFNHQREVPRYSRMVPLAEIADKNAYNLNIPRYIDASEPEDIHDLDGHLNGGIPKRDLDLLERYWQHFPKLRSQLFKADEARSNYFHSQIAARQLKTTILSCQEYLSFYNQTMQLFHSWKERHSQVLKDITQGADPKQIIHYLSEDLLQTFANAPLLDKYDVYQLLMNYWADTFQDDVFMLAQEGWSPRHLIREVMKDDKGKDTEKPDLILGSGKNARKYKTDFVKPEVVIEHYFAEDQAALDALQLKQDEAAQALEEHAEEHSGDDGVLADVSNKSEAQVELIKVEDMAWKAFDKGSFQKYEQLNGELEMLIMDVTSMEEDYAFEGFRVKGKVKASDVKKRLPEHYSLEENNFFEQYLKQQTKITRKRKQLKQQREAWQLAFASARDTRPDEAIEFLPELRIIERYLALVEEEATAKKAVKEAQEALNLKVFEKYGQLDEFEMRVLLVDRKWLPTLEGVLTAEVERMIQQFANRLRDLHERYAQTLSSLEQQVAELSQIVDGHLRKMGLAW